MNAPLAPLYQIRVYGQPGDAELISSWWAEHGQGVLPVGILPPTGFFVERDGEPVAVSFLYLSIGVGVAFIEWSISKAEQKPSEVKEAFRVLIDFMKLHADSLDYGVLMCHTSRSIAEFLGECGFEKTKAGLVLMVGISNMERVK